MKDPFTSYEGYVKYIWYVEKKGCNWDWYLVLISWVSQ
jgi:hypothetical protein